MSDAYIDSLQGCDQDVVTVLGLLRERRSGDRRAFIQHQFGSPLSGSAAMTVYHPGGSMAKLRGLKFDLSEGGMGVLIGSSVYPRSACDLLLTSEDGEELLVDCQVAYCTNISGKVHLAGLAFSNPIEARIFLGVLESPGRARVRDLDAIRKRCLELARAVKKGDDPDSLDALIDRLRDKLA